MQGCISAGESVIGDNLEMSGTATLAHAVNVRKRLFSRCDLSCGWTCHGGDIEVHGNPNASHAITASCNLVSASHVKSDNRVQVRGALTAGGSTQSASSIFAGQNITAGKDYGIHAGIAAPSPLHHEHGYIACPSMPRRIRSGEHGTIKIKKVEEIAGDQLASKRWRRRNVLAGQFSMHQFPCRCWCICTLAAILSASRAPCSVIVRQARTRCVPGS